MNKAQGLLLFRLERIVFVFDDGLEKCDWAGCCFIQFDTK